MDAQQQDSTAHIWLPQYYRENFFSNDSLYHPELSDHVGVAGDPVPYTLRGDNLVTSILLLSFILFVVAFSGSKSFIRRQFKELIFIPHTDDYIRETSSEIRFMLFLVVLTCLLMAFLGYQYVVTNIADTFILDSQYQLLGILFALLVGYFLAKFLFYTIVNNIFFDSKRNGQWMRSLVFITSLEGIALYPAVLLQVYRDMSVQNVVFYFVFVLILTKILTFYKSWVIFFRHNVFFLQNILYFCALEIVPLLVFSALALTIVDHLKVIF